MSLLFVRGNFLDLYINLYKGGWICLSILQEIKRDSFLEELKVTNQIKPNERGFKDQN